MKKTLYTKNCADCHKVFRTDNPKQRLCPSCLSFKKPKKATVKPIAKKKLSIGQVLHIEEIYNRVNGTAKHYGEIVRIIENTKADRCVCCGDIIPEGRMVCPICESGVAKNGG